MKKKYDRIISIAVLEHITDLPLLLRQSLLHLSPGGVFQTAIPTEGGFLWKTAYKYSTGLAYKFRTGYDYENIMRYEHVNKADEIEDILSYYFKNITINRFPFNIYNLSFYSYIFAKMQ